MPYEATIELCNDFVSCFFSNIAQKVYSNNIMEFCTYIDKDFCDATKEDCEKYANYIKDLVFDNIIATNTGYAKLSCLSSFGKFIINNIDEDFINHFAYITRPTHEFYLQDADMPTFDDIMIILDSAGKDKRLKAMLSLVIHFAFTTSDIIYLKTKDILLDTKGFPYGIAVSRYSQQFILKLDKATAKALKDYMDNTYFHNEFLFNNNSYKQFSARHIQKTIRSFMKKTFADEKYYTLNTLRNASISMMYAAGASDQDISIITKMTLSNNMERYIRAKRLYECNMPNDFIRVDIIQTKHH